MLPIRLISETEPLTVWLVHKRLCRILTPVQETITSNFSLGMHHLDARVPRSLWRSGTQSRIWWEIYFLFNLLQTKIKRNENCRGSHSTPLLSRFQSRKGSPSLQSTPPASPSPRLIPNPLWAPLDPPLVSADWELHQQGAISKRNSVSGMIAALGDLGRLGF